MKKNRLLLIIFVVLFVAQNINAQIQRNFLGFTFGVTTKTQVVNTLKTKNYKIEKQDNETFLIHNVKFSGQNWEDVLIKFYKNKFMEIWFVNSERTMSRGTIIEFDRLFSENIQAKYGKYKIDYSDQGETYYDDNKTRLRYLFDSYNNMRILSLVYYDIRLSDEKALAEQNEL